MAKQIKFTIGGYFDGYKTVELAIDGAKVFCKILRNGLLSDSKKISSAIKISDAELRELDALKIFTWDKEYYNPKILDGTQWELIFKDGDKIYRGGGSNAYPENFERFLDWLDAFFPELEFINRRRLERVTIDYAGEHLVLDRAEKTLTLDKEFSNHLYDAAREIKKIFDAAQIFFDGTERKNSDINFSTQAKFELVRHDGSIETFETPYNENFLPGLTNFIAAIKEIADDLTAEVFVLQRTEAAPPRNGKYILCKVQFPGSYKHYTYSTDDETLAIGDIVDVPVGRYNDITQARLVEIGYFDEYETPFPVERIKKIIGKHISGDWENF